MSKFLSENEKNNMIQNTVVKVTVRLQSLLLEVHISVRVINMCSLKTFYNMLLYKFYIAPDASLRIQMQSHTMCLSLFTNAAISQSKT